MATIEFLRAQIERIGLSHLAPHIMSHAKPCIDMSLKIAGKWDNKTDTVIDETPIGISKFGGHPDVLPNFEWPYIDGVPLPLLAQIRLEDIAPFDIENELPHTGLLLFFFDITLVIWSVTHIYHVEDVTSLVRASAPDDLPEFGVSEPRILSFSSGWSLPAGSSLEMEAVFKEHGSSIQETLYNEMDTYAEWYFTAIPHHRLLGHAFFQHYDTRPEVASIDDDFSSEDYEEQAEKCRLDAPNWRLFIQFDSEFEMEGAVHDIQWGNKNCIHLLIRDSDLKARNFSRVYEVS